jgi:hypothetical protein
VQHNLALERAADRASLLPDSERLDPYLVEAVALFPGDRHRAVENDALATLAARYLWVLKIAKAQPAGIQKIVADLLGR